MQKNELPRSRTHGGRYTQRKRTPVAEIFSQNSTDEALFVSRASARVQKNIRESKKLAKDIRKRVQVLRNKFYAEEAARFTEADSRRQVEKAYRIAKAQVSTRRNKVKQTSIPGLSAHYNEHFNHQSPTDPPLILQLPRPYPKVPIDYDVSAPTLAEIVDIINKTKNGKASLDLPVDLFKIALESPDFVENLTTFYQKIWTSEKVPAYLAESVIVAIWKNKGSRNDPKTWRGIMLSSILTKILSCIFVSRIKQAYNLNISENQMGFRDGRGCQDGNDCLKRMQQWCRKRQRELFVGMVDLSSTIQYNLLNKVLLLNIIRVTMVSRDEFDVPFFQFKHKTSRNT